MASDRTADQWAEWWAGYEAKALWKPDATARDLILLFARAISPEEGTNDNGYCTWCHGHLLPQPEHFEGCPVPIAQAILEIET